MWHTSSAILLWPESGTYHGSLIEAEIVVTQAALFSQDRSSCRLLLQDDVVVLSKSIEQKRVVTDGVRKHSTVMYTNYVVSSPCFKCCFSTLIQASLEGKSSCTISGKIISIPSSSSSS